MNVFKTTAHFSTELLEFQFRTKQNPNSITTKYNTQLINYSFT